MNRAWKPRGEAVHWVGKYGQGEGELRHGKVGQCSCSAAGHRRMGEGWGDWHLYFGWRDNKKGGEPLRTRPSHRLRRAHRERQGTAV